jgi:hypothetical protein
VVRVMVMTVWMLAACAVEPPVDETRTQRLDQMASEDFIAVESENDEPDLCGLAAELPADDLCSLICDPDALEAALIAQGTPVGRCVTMICPLSETVTAHVGVCLL